jgi:hypothetical protein
MEADRKEFHQFVCGDVAVPEDDITNHALLKMLFKVLALFDGSVDELKEFLEANKEPRTIFDFDFSDENDPMYLKNLMLASLSIKNCRLDDVKTLVFVKCYNMILRNKKLKKMWKSPRNRKFLDELLCKLFQVYICGNESVIYTNINVSMDDKVRNAVQQKDAECHYIMSHIDPAIWLLSHSCLPNIAPKSFDDKTALFVVFPVKKGQQISVQYLNGHLLSMTKTDRQAITVRDHGFLCDCIACVNDIPLYHDMESKIHQFTGFAPYSQRLINAVDEVQREYYNCCDMMNHYFHLFPCKELYTSVSTQLRLLDSLTLPAPWFQNKQLL